MKLYSSCESEPSSLKFQLLKMKTLYISIVFATLFHLSHSSNVTFSLNPGCDASTGLCLHRKLGYANYFSNDTSYHYIVDLDQVSSVVSLLIVQTPSDDHTPGNHINWTSLALGTSESISYKNMTNAIGLVFSDLILEQYNDEGKAFTNTTLKMKDFNSTFSLSQQDGSIGVNIGLIYHGNQPVSDTNFSMNLTFTINNQTVRHHMSPALLYNVGSMHTECTFTNALPVVKNKSNIILPLDLIQFGSFSQSQSEIISDEHSPGVFSLDTYSSVNSTTTGDIKSFLQFRSVAYYKADHMVVSGFEVYPSPTNVSVEWDKSAAFGYFSGQQNFNHHQFNFHLNTHDLYNKSNYTSFSFVLGLGEGPNEKLSTTLTLYIIIGFGLPALALLAGVIYLVTKKVMQSRRTGQRTVLIDTENHYFSVTTYE